MAFFLSYIERSSDSGNFPGGESNGSERYLEESDQTRNLILILVLEASISGEREREKPTLQKLPNI